MTLMQAMLQGLVQGLTEYLPVSSSGHLAILNLLFPSGGGSVDFSFFLHVATLISSTIFFRVEIYEIFVCWLPKNSAMKAQRKLFLLLIMACLVTGPVGLIFDPMLESWSSSTLILGFAFLVTASLLAITQYASTMRPGRKIGELTYAKSALIGLFQGFAVIPAISRSGSTIAGGVFAGLDKKSATKFSFLVGMPIILAGALKDGVNILQGEILLPSLLACIIGFVVAAISGYLAIRWMISCVSNIKLYWFSLYTAALGIGLLIYTVYGG